MIRVRASVADRSCGEGEFGGEDPLFICRLELRRRLDLNDKPVQTGANRWIGDVRFDILASSD
jgi:hypothetical protein